MPEPRPMLQFIVARESTDIPNLHHAVVTCAQTDKITDAASLKDAIRYALMDWFRTADCEHDRDTRDDYNIGDLYHDIVGAGPDDMLISLLADNGVHDLDIDIVHTDDREPNWMFDDVLSDTSDEEDDDD